MRFKVLLLFLAASSLIALATAYVAEMFFKIPPCKLCYFQRIIFCMLIAFCIYFYFTKYQLLKPTILLLLLVLSSSLSFYHMGIEKGWFQYSSECTSGFIGADDFEEYKNMLNQKDIVACDQVAFEFLGLSLAGWNFVYSTILLSFTIIIGIKTKWFNKDEINT